MYNEKILSQLNELRYLHVIKNANISVMSKKNTYHDMVKFYAQINKEDVIQKISYKATGCTHFVVFCNHFCNLVEGKSVKDALKVNEQKLEEFVELSESRKHITKIIVDTFALLIKKYRKGIEKGLIEPVEVSISSSEEVKESKKITSEKKIKAITKEHKEIKYTTDSKLTKKENKTTKKTKTDTIADSQATKNNKKESKKEPKADKKTSKVDVKDIEVSESKSIEASTVEEIKESSDKKNSKSAKKSNKSKVTKNSKKETDLKSEAVDIYDSGSNNDVVESNMAELAEPIYQVEQPEVEVVQPEIQKQTVVVERTEYYKREVNINQKSIKQADNIVALKSMVQSSKSHVSHSNSGEHLSQTDISNLSMMIHKLDKSSENYEDDNAKRLHALSNNLASIKANQSVESNDNMTKEESSKITKRNKKSKQENLENKESKPEKKKRGLFGWLRK